MFSAPFFSDLFPWASQARLVLVVWGAHCWKRVILGGLYSSRCCGGSPLFPVLSFVTVGHWVIERPRNGSGGGLLELLLSRFQGFLVLALLTVHSAQRQQGRGLRVLGTNCSLHQSEFRLCPKVVLDWFLGLPVRSVLGLPILGYGHWLCAVPLIMAGWCAPVSRCSCRLACMPHIPQLPYAAGFTVSVGFILAPLPYRMVNAGSCDYKKKKKKKKRTSYP